MKWGKRQMKAVIFDMDGLLIDSEIISYKLYQDFLRPYGYEFSVDFYAQNYSGKTAVANMNAIIEKYNLPIDAKEGMAQIAVVEKKYIKEGIDLKFGAKELLKYLKDNNYKIALASSSIKERALTILKSHNIQDYFDEMVFGVEIKRSKPYPDIFLKACQKLNEDPKDCLVLEDSEAGIQAAYSGHVPVICIPDMKKPTEKYSNMTECNLKSLLDVIDYLEKNK